ncbi:GtrA family protein [Rhizobium sp. KVB221]|uniref:GtrA family protein n=1 Tax=Rhizobium setariae TaxID=2801340 RepID=A0A936YSB2_9HYPH|nr:GtrA family protein [Rhizobium setariae]
MPKRLIKFTISGACATGIHVVIAWVLIEHYATDPAFANGIAFLIATSFSWVANTLWTFDASLGWANVKRFAIATSFMLLISMSIAKSIDLAGFPGYLGIFCVVIALPAITFVVHNNWTYK